MDAGRSYAFVPILVEIELHSSPFLALSESLFGNEFIFKQE